MWTMDRNGLQSIIEHVASENVRSSACQTLDKGSNEGNDRAPHAHALRFTPSEGGMGRGEDRTQRPLHHQGPPQHG